MSMKLIYLSIIIASGIVASLFIIMTGTAEDKFQKDNLKFNYMPCDVKCKTTNEQIGRSCTEQQDGNYFCTSSSRFSTPVAIPFGSKDMPHQRDFIPANITLSLQINNTVNWVNEDDYPHRITSDDGSFDSGIMLPNGTWTHIFDKIGTYAYHGDYPWLKGQITVVDFDQNYKGTTPLFMDTNQPSVFYYIFKETDSFWYIKSVKVIDNNYVLVTLSDYGNNAWIGTPITKTLKTGDSFIGNCGDNITPPQIEFLTVDKIVTDPVPFVKFKDQTGHISYTKCSFDKLEK